MRFLICVIFISSILKAQDASKEELKDNIIFLSINHTFQIPANDLVKRFGNNSNISTILSYKSHNDVLLNIEGGVIFGPTVKEDNLFNNINGSSGTLISQNGEIPTIRFFQRGAHLDVSIGRYFKLPTEKSESGLILTLGAGYLYHKILIETLTMELPQLNQDLLKGYDRLSGGILTKQFIGYLHFSKKNNIRYILGLEFVQGLTKNLRQYNYTTQSRVNGTRKDYLFGLKCGFIIPIKKRRTERYYYY